MAGNMRITRSSSARALATNNYAGDVFNKSNTSLDSFINEMVTRSILYLLIMLLLKSIIQD